MWGVGVGWGAMGPNLSSALLCLLYPHIISSSSSSLFSSSSVTLHLPPHTTGLPSIPLNGRTLTAAFRAPLCPRDPRSVSPVHPPLSLALLPCLHVRPVCTGVGEADCVRAGGGLVVGSGCSFYSFNKQ